MPFDTRLLAGVGVLAAVVESGSFVRAAEALGLSDSGVSRAIARLEARVGIRLLARTTRSLHLTDEGARFYEDVAPLLAGIEDAAVTAAGAAIAVRGRLRVDTDPFFARLILAPKMPAFLARYPDLELELLTREKVGELVADGIDLSLRFGPPPTASTISRQLLATRILTVAAPGYLKRRGRPVGPADLAGHACIQFRDPVTGRPFPWEFHKGKRIIGVETHGALTLSDVGTMLNVCLAGGGIAQVMALGVAEFLAEGRLVELFPDWPGETFPLTVIYPSRHHPPANVRAFVSFCLNAFA